MIHRRNPPSQTWRTFLENQDPPIPGKGLAARGWCNRPAWGASLRCRKSAGFIIGTNVGQRERQGIALERRRLRLFSWRALGR